jgi:hypothetical protein
MTDYFRQNRWTLALLVANLVLVWALPLIPAQDLPQHLTYIRIFADYGNPDLLFKDFYTLPTGFQPYDTVYLLLAVIARYSSVMFALRLALTAYVILMFVGFDIIAAACHGREHKGSLLPSTVLASMTIWGSAFAMGFLQYFLAIPLVLITAGWMVRGCDEKEPDWVGWAVVPAAIAVASMHLVAAGALAVFATLYVLLSLRDPGSPRRLEVACRVIGMLGLTLIAWHFLGGEVLGAKPRAAQFDDAWRNAQGFEFVNTLLQTTWYDPPVTFNYLSWAVLGPYRIMGLGVAALAVAVCLWFVVPVYEAGLAPGSGELRLQGRQYARAAWGFALFSVLLPWGINVPSEVTYLNFRVISLAFALLMPLVPPRWFSIPNARRALNWVATAYLLNFTVHAVGFNYEARAPIHLLSRVPTREVVLSLVFRSRSSYFAKGFRLTHFLPMYFTVLDGGVCSQFWAKYTEHLPIDYRPGKRIAQPDDWSPQNFDETKHLHDSDWVLFQRATADDPKGGQNDAIRAEQKLNQRADVVECDGGWCLYKVRTHT